METRRGGRQSHVRPRPPSNGRPAPVRVRPVAPAPTRLARHRRIDRRRGLPLVLKVSLALAVAALGATVVWVGSGGIGPFVASISSAFEGFADGAKATATPSPLPTGTLSDAPGVAQPAEPYTSSDVVDVTVNLPSAVVGEEGYVVRLWVTLEDTPSAIVAEVAVGPTSALVIADIELAKGRNDFQASIVGPAGESERSEVITWILDQSPPKVSITSPKDGAAVNRDSVNIKGKTQANSTIVARNEENGATATSRADADGVFSVRVAIAAGINGITVTATDPAGNANSEVLSVRRGSGRLTASLTGSLYRFQASKLPKDVRFTVRVTDPDGRPLSGATALFTITVPGLEAIVSGEITTAGDGTAVFRTRIPKGALRGSGLASVLVTSREHGTTTDRQVLTVTK